MKNSNYTLLFNMEKQNTLTQMGFFGTSDDSVDASQESDNCEDKNIPKHVSPPSSSRKKRKSISTNVDFLQSTFSTIDYKGRGKPIHIMGYTDTWFDKKYIKLMHECLVDQIDFISRTFNKILNEFEIEAPDEEVPEFIKRARRFLKGPLLSARRNILAYDKIVLHVLSDEGIAAVINVSNCETTLDFVTKLCRSDSFVGTAHYSYASNEATLEVNFDGEISYYTFDNTPLSPVIELVDNA